MHRRTKSCSCRRVKASIASKSSWTVFYNCQGHKVHKKISLEKDKQQQMQVTSRVLSKTEQKQKKDIGNILGTNHCRMSKQSMPNTPASKAYCNWVVVGSGATVPATPGVTDPCGTEEDVHSSQQGLEGPQHSGAPLSLLPSGLGAWKQASLRPAENGQLEALPAPNRGGPFPCCSKSCRHMLKGTGSTESSL